MGRQVLKTTNLHGFSIDELIKLEESYQKKSIKSLIITVIMRYQGIHTEEIQSFKQLLKKAADLLDIIENASDMVLYVQDETKIRVESNNYRSWIPIGELPTIERNGSRKGVNIIGATEISKNFDSIVNVYSSDERITSNEVKEFITNYLNHANSNKAETKSLVNARSYYK